MNTSSVLRPCRLDLRMEKVKGKKVPCTAQCTIFPCKESKFDGPVLNYDGNEWETTITQRDLSHQHDANNGENTSSVALKSPLSSLLSSVETPGMSTVLAGSSESWEAQRRP